MIYCKPLAELHFIDKKKYLVIDPGVKNLSVCHNDTVYLFHFDDVYELFSDYNFNKFLTYLKKQEHVLYLVCENQISRTNILVQGLLCGYLYSKLNVVGFCWFAPSLKKKFTMKNFSFNYIKVKSNKQYLRQPMEFQNYLHKWNLIEIKKTNQFKLNFENYKNVKKKDDFIDCIIISSYLKLI